MTNIRVNPEKLKWGGREFDTIAEEINTIGKSLYHMTMFIENANPKYAIQIAGMLRGEVAYASSEARVRASGIEELGRWLLDKADRFEEADRASQEGMYRLLAANEALMKAVGETPFVPLYILNGTKPPDFDVTRWWDLPREDQEMIILQRQHQWARFMASRTTGSFREPIYSLDYLEEMFQIYMYGLPASLFDPDTGEQVSAYIPEHELFEKPNLPDGSEEYDYAHWQDQDLEALISNPRTQEFLIDLDINKTQAWHRRHINLCGIDAAGHAVGVDHMIQAYAAFSHIREEMLINNDTAWVYEIKALYEEMGWETIQAGRFASSEVHWDDFNHSASPEFDDVKNYLEQGYVITALTNVDSVDPNGFLTADPNIESGHFPNIIETMTTQDGTQLIRVYNSMEHREEIYTWEQFQKSWEDAGPNDGGQAVLARPPAPVP